MTKRIIRTITCVLLEYDLLLLLQCNTYRSNPELLYDVRETSSGFTRAYLRKVFKSSGVRHVSKKKLHFSLAEKAEKPFRRRAFVLGPAPPLIFPLPALLAYELCLHHLLASIQSPQTHKALNIAIGSFQSFHHEFSHGSEVQQRCFLSSRA